jgi:hypothetical protein
MPELIVSFNVWGVENGFKVIVESPRKGVKKILLRPEKTEYVALSNDQLLVIFEKLVHAYCSDTYDKLLLPPGAVP